MRRTPSLFLLLAFALLASPVFGAGFDCAKATSRVEKQVCADPALSQLDEALANEYRSALADGDSSLRASQLAWLKQRRDACKSAECLVQAYKDRIDELRGGLAVYPDLAGAIIDTCSTLSAKAGANSTDCRVLESGEFGKLGEDTQAWARYCLDPSDDARQGRPCDLTGVALFSVEAPMGKTHRWLVRVDGEGGGNQFAKPELLRVKGAQLLYLPVSVPGTGAFNASSLYRRDGARWIQIDTTSWQKDFAAKLPKGLAVWKGIWPDWRRMHASTGMYRAKDANCCATGGTAEIELALQGNRVELVSYKILSPRR
jgi:uncharacterized protein YecT (DUF1311 family)